MKILDKYIVSSILKTAFVAILAFAFILAGVELFSKIDTLITGKIPFMQVFKYLLLSLPEYLMMGSSLALLFATTYFLSMLSANNERIAILNAGLSKLRLARPIILLSVFLTVLGIGYQEFILNDLISLHDELSSEIFGSTSTQDTRNIVLKDENGYLVYTRRFNANSNTIYDPVIIKKDGERLLYRLEAKNGFYDGSSWILTNVLVYENTEEKMTSRHEDSYTLRDMDLDPSYFKSSNIKVETMDFVTAQRYLKRLKSVEAENWQTKATDYYRSLFAPLAIFVLMTVSATLDYNFKKNVLLFSIIQSLSIAVVYY
ncbi:MAG: LptF/LptG family permease, partial [Spirochaetales bacterium]|nr:LptF/LptG family permease [Candidatus Physcosoma equi]